MAPVIEGDVRPYDRSWLAKLVLPVPLVGSRTVDGGRKFQPTTCVDNLGLSPSTNQDRKSALWETALVGYMGVDIWQLQSFRR